MKQIFLDGVRRTALAVGSLGITPNGLTYASLAPAIAAGFAAATGAFTGAVICLLLSGLCDLLDGSLARATGKATPFGALLDSTIDRLCDAAPLLGLIVFFAPSGWPAVVPGFTLVGGYTISYVRARAEGLGLKLPWLWMRRTDRLLILGLALLLGGVAWPSAGMRAPLTLLVVGLAGVLNVFAFVAALSAARRWLKRDVKTGPA